ncbi:DUF4183 domain-containing protein [Brevibacillus reuszeri]|uniref:DUF4183 domain-containing protein n=1 Tax=Brevibacillus reuszeri TaxID=54915 RepID=UPI001BB300FA|nr:DUF4183 domain-containing protein [Brevibacillus reuszeri]
MRYYLVKQQKVVNNVNARSPGYLIIPPLGCPDVYPGQPCPTCPPCPCTPGLLQTEIFQYTAISDGMKNVYKNSDAVIQFSTSGILDPNSVSIVNLFINGILQTSNLYTLQPGALILSDVPVQGVPLILQFIKITSS